MAKTQPSSKIKKKAFDLTAVVNSFKTENDLIAKKGDELEKSSADKELSWIIMPEAFQETVKLPGIPWGYVTVITGWSNTGKSTLINCAIASCMQEGALPIIYDTENNFDFTYAIDCGMKASPIYGEVEEDVIDEETGEITGTKKVTKIIDYEGNFIYFDSKRLAKRYGKMDYSKGTETAKERKIAVIEDIAYSINEFLDLQDEGVIQCPICFFWDSVGSIQGYRAHASKVGNAMFDAASLASSFTTILNNRIPSSRKKSSEFTNSLVCVNKIWNDAMNAVGQAASIELKGGKSIFYAARLIIHMGGMAKAGVTKLMAVAKGEKYNYGTLTNIRVNKNQLPVPYNVTYEGKLACVHNGLIGATDSDLDKYKKEYSKLLLEKLSSSLGSTQITEKDIKYVTEEENV